MPDKKFYEKYMTRFLEENSLINLISKNDEKFLWEKHVFDSLGIEKFFKKYTPDLKGKTLIDIGTGGGFPALPIALTYSELEVTALDSIAKKLRSIERISTDLGIKNLKIECTRAEKHKCKYDIATSRAVGKLGLIAKYALPLLKKDGYFVAYKSKSAEMEISEALETIEKSGGKIIEVMRYELPLPEIFERNLIIIKKVA